MILRWAVVLLSLVLPRLASAQSTASHAESPEKGLVLVGALASPEERTALRDLYASVLIAVQGGMESGIANDCPTGRDLCFGHVESYDDLIRRARMTNQIADRGYLRLATMRSVSTGTLELRGYVGVQILQLGQGFAVEVVVFRERDGELKPIRRKFVTAESGAGELVQLATELGQRIALGMRTKPVVQLRHEANRNVRVGEDVVLDASASQDFDFDHLYWLWKQVDGPKVLPDEGSVRSALHFVAQQPGTYRFKVEVRDHPPEPTSATSGAANSNDSNAAVEDVVVKAGEEPKPRVFAPEVGEKTPYEVQLNAACAEGNVCGWTQVEGPPTTLPRPEQAKASATPEGCGEKRPPTVTTSKSGDARLRLTLPGLYRFQWKATNCFGTTTATKTVLVAPPPMPMADVPSVVFLGNSAVLDGSGSYDPLGQPVAYLWTVTRDLKSGACAASADKTTDGYYVTTPSAAEAVLRAGDVGTYSVALTVTATHKVEDHVLVRSVCVQKVVKIIPRRLELQPLGGLVKGGHFEQVSFGMFVAGSIAVGGEWRMHVQQILFRHIQQDNGGATTKPFGGTRLLASYSFRPTPIWMIRPATGFTLRAIGDSGDAWGPRLALDLGVNSGNRFVVVATGGSDFLYYFGQKKWGVSPDVSVGFGFTL